MSGHRMTDDEWMEQQALFLASKGKLDKDDCLVLAHKAEQDNRGLVAHAMLMQALDLEQQE